MQEINLYFDDDDIEYLYNARCKNFIKEQKERFVLIRGENFYKGSAYFCDSYLEAKVIFTLKSAKAIYSDEFTADFCVVVDEKFEV